MYLNLNIYICSIYLDMYTHPTLPLSTPFGLGSLKFLNLTLKWDIYFGKELNMQYGWEQPLDNL